MKKIKGHPEIQWRYVPTNENPADIASRSGQVADSELWWRGPEWLSDATRWPKNPITGSSPASEAEVIKEVLSLAQQPSKKDMDVFKELLERHDLPKSLRIQARVRRFCTGRVHSGPVTSEEVRKEKMWWIKRVQNEDSKNPHFVETSRKLNLVKNNEGIYECHGRLQGSFPTYLPADALFTKKLVRRTHVETLHGGVLLTMAAVRETYWIPKLRKLVKSVRGSCWGCKRFTAVPIVKPPPGNLPTDRTWSSIPSHRNGLRRSDSLPDGQLARRKELLPHLLVQSVASRAPGVGPEPRNRNFHSVLEKAHRQERTTSCNLFGQRCHVSESSEMVKASEKRRTSARPASRIRNDLDVQPESCPLVGWTIRKTNRSGKVSDVQGYWGSHAVLVRTE